MPTLTIPKCQSALSPAVRRVIHSSNFKRWFGDSKVVDDKGQPLVVYHGTKEWKNEVINDKYRVGKFFSSSPDVASKFGKQVLPVYLKLANPFIVDAKEAFYSQIATPSEMKGFTKLDTVDTDMISDFAHKNGYDGVIIKNTTEGNGAYKTADDYIVFRPEQIKSIFNRGTFDPNNPNILE